MPWFELIAAVNGDGAVHFPLQISRYKGVLRSKVTTMVTSVEWARADDRIMVILMELMKLMILYEEEKKRARGDCGYFRPL